MKRVTLVLLILSLVLLGACSKKTDVPTSPGRAASNSNGDANFTTYVAIGNSLCAGYQSSALYQSAQVSSYPALIAKQAGVVSFEQPLISDPGIGGRIHITAVVPSPVLSTDSVFAGHVLNATLARPYNNLGIPGAILYDIIDTTEFTAKSTARANPFFQIVLRSQLMGKSVLAQASALHPTFITVEVGANDVLGYATSGGTSGSNPTHDGPSDVPTFGYLYGLMIAGLKAANPNAQIVVANIPDVTAIPFFTTVPLLPVAITTKSGVRVAAAGDYLLLTAQSFLQQGFGTAAKPLPDAVVLDRDEVAIVETALNGFNAAIEGIAAQNNLAMVDLHAFLNVVNTTGVSFGGQTFTSKFITGGLFSFDGVHPSSRGYALMANEFLKAINVKYNANIRLIDPMSVDGLSLGKKAVPDGIPIPYTAIPAEAARAVPRLILGR